MLYFIHQVALEQAVSSDIRNDRDVDYNQNDLFKRSLTWGVYRKTLVIGRDAEPWLLIGGGLSNDAFGWLRWFEMVWRPSCWIPLGFPAREYPASGLGFKCPEISDLGGSARTFGPAVLQKQSAHCGILAENHWNKVWNTCECTGPHMGSPGQRWTPPCFLVFNTSSLIVLFAEEILLLLIPWGF